MKRKRKEKKPLDQLCLFSDEQMNKMVELPPEIPKTIPTGNIDTWVQWQMQIGEGLKGKAGREHRKMLTAKKARVARATDKQITEGAIRDCLRDGGHKGQEAEDLQEVVMQLLGYS